MKNCLHCQKPLTGRQQKYCCDAHRKAHERRPLADELTPDATRTTVRMPAVDLSGLSSEFTAEALRQFAQYVLSMADCEREYAARLLVQIEKLPAPNWHDDPKKLDNDALHPERRKFMLMVEKHYKSEAIFRWIADEIIRNGLVK